MKSILGVSLLILLMPSASPPHCRATAPTGSACMMLTARDATTLPSTPARTDSLGLWMRSKSGWATAVIPKKEFSAIEKQNIIKYLNDQFYQFR